LYVASTAYMHNANIIHVCSCQQEYSFKMKFKKYYA